MTTSNNHLYTIEERFFDGVPESFFEAMQDVNEGNTIDLDIALNEKPPEH